MVLPIAARLVGYAASRALRPGLGALTRRQQQKAITASVAGGIATEASLQLLGLSAWTTNGNRWDCGAVGEYIRTTGGCGNIGSNITTTWPDTALRPDRNPVIPAFEFRTYWRMLANPHPVFGVGYALQTATGVLRNTSAQPRRAFGPAPLYLPTLGAVQTGWPEQTRYGRKPLPVPIPGVIAGAPAIPDAAPYDFVPPWFGTVPGLSSRPGPAPWEPAQPARPVAPPAPRPGTVNPADTIPRFVPGFIPRAVPARLEHHTKVAFAPAGAAPIIFSWLDTVSEFSDVVDAVYRALPAHVRRNYTRAIKRQGDAFGGLGGGARQADAIDIKLEAIWKHRHELDGEAAAANLLVNAVEDMAIGETERQRGRLFNRARGM